MKVMHIITRMIIGGAQENTLYNCVDLIEQHGDEVLLVTGPSLGAEGNLLNQSDQVSLEVETVGSLIRSINPLQDSKALSELKKIIRRWQPDVVHTHSAKAGLLGRAAGWSLRVPCVVHTVHGAPFHPFQNPLSRRFFTWCERWAAKRCHHMISVADAMTDLMVSAGVAKAEKFTTISSGMEVTPFAESAIHRDRMRRQLGFSEQDIVFGKIARLFHLKGHEYVVSAAFETVRSVPQAKFLFVGDGLLMDSIKAKIRGTELEGRFVFTGLVPPSEIPAHISAMDVLVHASLREGLARALPQSLIAGKPAISFDVDGAREVVINGATGCLVPAKDVDGLARAMIELGTNSEMRRQYGAEGAKRFTDQFRHETMTKRIREVYSKVLSGIQP
ncbi:MAG: glycosyltransferase family 4 protein [Pirellula sp.]|jgi:glycosyltransferase involved in cell wall biosynthesis